MIHIDKPADAEVVQQFATQVPAIPPNLRRFLDDCFTNDQSLDFYRGLLAGTMNAYQFRTLKDANGTTGACMALIAAKLLEMEAATITPKTEIIESMKPTRKEVLLRAAYDLLQKADRSHYVGSVTEILVRYDDAECDGSCLMTDIATELGIKDDEG